MSAKRALDVMLGAGLGASAMYLVASQFSRTDPTTEAQMPEEVKNNRLKKTLT